MPRRPPRALPALLALSILAGAARAEDVPEAQGEPPPENGWLDVGHAFIEQRIFAPVLRLDRFFSDERDIEAERSRSFLRWRSEVRVAEDASRASVTTGVRATLRLPGLNRQLRRLRLVIAGETRDTVDALFPAEPDGTGTPEPTVEDEGIGTAETGLRLSLWDSVLAHADLGGGVLLGPLGGYGRLRFRWVVPVKTLFLTRSALTGFWRSDVHFGATAALELERPLTRSLVARLAGASTLSEESRGLEWSAELALVAWLSPRLGAAAAISLTGATDGEALAADPPRTVPLPDVERFRAYVRLRRDFYRRWLFLELEPELAWPWTPERGRYHAWGIIFRVEVQFQGKEAPPPPPPPPPPEPEDPPGS